MEGQSLGNLGPQFTPPSIPGSSSEAARSPAASSTTGHADSVPMESVKTERDFAVENNNANVSIQSGQSASERIVNELKNQGFNPESTTIGAKINPSKPPILLPTNDRTIKQMAVEVTYELEDTTTKRKMFLTQIVYTSISVTEKDGKFDPSEHLNKTYKLASLFMAKELAHVVNNVNPGQPSKVQLLGAVADLAQDLAKTALKAGDKSTHHTISVSKPSGGGHTIHIGATTQKTIQVAHYNRIKNDIHGITQKKPPLGPKPAASSSSASSSSPAGPSAPPASSTPQSPVFSSKESPYLSPEMPTPTTRSTPGFPSSPEAPTAPPLSSLESLHSTPATSGSIDTRHLRESQEITQSIMDEFELVLEDGSGSIGDGSVSFSLSADDPFPASTVIARLSRNLPADLPAAPPIPVASVEVGTAPPLEEIVSNSEPEAAPKPSTNEIKKEHVINELKYTEQTYNDSLNKMSSFAKVLENSNNPEVQQFGNKLQSEINELLSRNDQFSQKLAAEKTVDGIATLFQSDDFNLYAESVLRFITASQDLNNEFLALSKKYTNELIAPLSKELDSAERVDIKSPVTLSYVFNDFSSRSFQRITRYPLLFTELGKNANPDEKENLDKAIDHIRTTAMNINDAKRAVDDASRISKQNRAFEILSDLIPQLNANVKIVLNPDSTIGTQQQSNILVRQAENFKTKIKPQSEDLNVVKQLLNDVVSLNPQQILLLDLEIIGKNNFVKAVLDSNEGHELKNTYRELLDAKNLLSTLKLKMNSIPNHVLERMKNNKLFTRLLPQEPSLLEKYTNLTVSNTLNGRAARLSSNAPSMDPATPPALSTSLRPPLPPRAQPKPPLPPR